MSKWVRGIYNSAANFNLSRSLRAASTWFVGRNREHVREECDKSDKCDKSCESSKSDQSVECGSYSDCLGCAPFSCARLDPSSIYYRGDNNDNGDAKYSATTIEYLSRDENGNDVPIAITITAREQDGIIDYTYSAEGKGAGSWVRVSDESGNTEQTTTTTRDPVEYSTGIPTGVTV